VADWHPGANKITGKQAGAHTGGGHKIVWHTTEGFSAEDAITTFHQTTDWPHFTFEYKNGRVRLFQHMPLSAAARALEHPSGTAETNRANAIQVELVGFAKDTPTWPAGQYAAIAELARWIERNFNVPRTCDVTFVPVGTERRLSGREFVDYGGHCGHQHAANQNSQHHTDPGELKIDLVLGGGSYASRALVPGDKGQDVGEFQTHLDKRLRARQLPEIVETEVFDPPTDAATKAVTFYLGFPLDVVARHGATPRVQRFVKTPTLRPPLYRVRARKRKRQPVP
jgi:N-acetylmuramoyl-L-alanine amidase